MLCEECGKNPATVSIMISTGSGTSTRRLCPDCMKQIGQNLAKDGIQSFLSSILSFLGKESKPEQTGLTCSCCGLTYAEFEKTGRLGCAQCYRDFAEPLTPVLQKIHGRTQHAGRKPAAVPASPADDVNERVQALRQRMEEAVASENFEDAARYRDELRTLLQQEVLGHE